MFCYNYPIETSKAKGFKMAKDFQKKLFNVTAKGTVLKVIANSKEAIQLNTIYNSVRLLVKLDNPIELDGQFDTVVGNWVVIVDYCDTTIKIDTLTVGSDVDVTLFGLTRTLSLVKARKLIDSFLDD